MAAWLRRGLTQWWTPWALTRRGAVATWSWPGAAACPPSPCLSTPIRWSVAGRTAHAIGPCGPALEGQLRRMQAAAVEIRAEGWDLVTTARQAQPEASHTPGARMRPASSGSGRSGWAWRCSCRDFPGVRTRQARHVAGRGGPRRRRGWPAGNRADGPPDPDPPDWLLANDTPGSRSRAMGDSPGGAVSPSTRTAR